MGKDTITTCQTSTTNMKQIGTTTTMHGTLMGNQKPEKGTETKTTSTGTENLKEKGTRKAAKVFLTETQEETENGKFNKH